jgi:hypothetical protein
VETTEDIYASIMEIGRRLSALGSPQWQVELSDAIASGSTATEILMKARWLLESVNEAGALPRSISEDIRALTGRIQKALA